MLTIDVPLTAGMGYVVPGGAETTGVLVVGSVWLHAPVAIKVAATKKDRISDLFFAFILDWVNFILFVWERFTGHAVFTFNPSAKVDELAAFRTEGAKGIVFPLGRFSAGWAFH
jgi:hypothetical protein